MNVFSEPSPRAKVQNLEAAMLMARGGQGETPPAELARSVPIVGIRELPNREGLSSPAGLGRVLYDLANIEMQALELGLRTLIEFYDRDIQFIKELEELTREESFHLTLCLDGLEKIGFPWGTWPVHTQLWKATQANDSLLDRILIVHRYQEGGGLEAGETLLRKFTGVARHDPRMREILDVVQSCVQKIFNDELGHVQFGSRWYNYFFQTATDRIAETAEEDFAKRLRTLMSRMPVRRERLSRDLRARAGFTSIEFAALESVQNKT